MAIQNSTGAANRRFQQVGSFTPGAAATELFLVIPAGTAGIRGRLDAGGSSGGSGARLSVTPAVGGIGGGPGGVVEFDFLLSQINCVPGDTLYISVANAVAGGAGQATIGGNGNAGTAGQSTVIRKTNAAGALIARAIGGNAGVSVGSTTNGATAGVPCSWGDTVGSVATLLQGATNATASRNTSTGGGNGCSRQTSTGNGANAGAPANELRTVAGATGGTFASGSPNGNSGTAISILSDSSYLASGGGGGSSLSSITSLVGNGGNGGVGAGGGGGGASINTEGMSGAGGNGGPGRAVIEMYAGGIAVMDSEANALIQVGGIGDATQIRALHELAKGLKANGTWGKYLAIYPFVGGTASAHSFNLKDPRDSDAAYRVTWNGSITHNSVGISSSSGGYGNTNLNPTLAGMSPGSVSLAAYTSRTTAGEFNGPLGVVSGADWTMSISDVAFAVFIQTSGSWPATATGSGGYYTGSRLMAPGVVSAYINGSEAASSPAESESASAPSLPFYLLGFNDSGALGYAFDSPLRYAAIGSGLTAAEVAADYAVIEAFQRALGRAL